MASNSRVAAFTVDSDGRITGSASIDALATDGDGSAVTVTATGATCGRSAADMAADRVNVLSFIPLEYHADIRNGALGSLTPTEQGAITAAITEGFQAALDTGRWVYAPWGKYWLNNTLTFLHNGQGLTGDGAGTRLEPAGDDLDIMAIGNDSRETLNVEFRDFAVWPRGTKTSGAALRLTNASRCIFRNLRFGLREDGSDIRFYDGLVVGGNAWGNNLFDGVEFLRGSNTGACLYATGYPTDPPSGNGSEIQFVNNCGLGGGWNIGLHIAGRCGGVDLASLDIMDCVQGMVVDGVLGGIPNREILAGPGFTVDSSRDVGVRFAAFSVSHANFTGSWFGGCVGNNVQIDAGQGDNIFHFTGCHNQGGLADGYVIGGGFIQITGGKIEWNGRGVDGGVGVRVLGASTDSVNITGVTFHKNGLGGWDHAPYHASNGGGVVIESGAAGVTVACNNIVSNALYGVSVAATVDRITVANNYLCSNATGSILNSAGVSATKLFANNNGSALEQYVPGALTTGGDVVAYGRLRATGVVADQGGVLELKDYGGATSYLYKMNGGATVLESSAFKVPNIGTTASAANAYLDAGVSNSLLRSTSSLMYKTNVEPLDPAVVRQIGPQLLQAVIWYRSTAPADRPDWSWYGMGAETVAAIDPRLVHWRYDDADCDLVLMGEGLPPLRVPRPDAELKPDGVQYDRVALILTLHLADRLAALEGA